MGRWRRYSLRIGPRGHAMSKMTQTIELEFKVANFKRTRAILDKLSDRGYYRGLFVATLKPLIWSLWNYARKITHVRLTGSLQRAQAWEYDSHKMSGRIYLNPRIVYATGSTLRWPARYGVFEHNRGGEHAFYDRTMKEAADDEVAATLRVMVKRLSWI